MRTRQETDWLIGLNNWLAMQQALVLREIRTRFSGDALGYAWAVIVPVTWILAITLFFRYLGRESPIAADLSVFVATGMLPYILFRAQVTALMRTERSGRHLLTIGPMEREDLYTAVSLLEGLNTVFVTAAVLAATALYAPVPLPVDPLGAFWALLLVWMLGASFGRLAGVLTRLTPATMRAVPILLRPFFWVSGVLFVAAELPPEVAGVLWYNPLLHATEALREAWFAGVDSDFLAPVVPLAASVGFYILARGIEALADCEALD